MDITTDNNLETLRIRSIEIIKDGQTQSGAYIAGPTFKEYQYSWFRDGSFIADAMSRAGEVESAERFFDWASRVVVSRKEKIEAGETLHARYTHEGLEGEGIWPNFQLDGFGTLVWAIDEHEKRHRIAEKKWDEAKNIIAGYLARRWREPSHDWWEEYAAIHPATLASIYAALRITNHAEAKSVRAAIDIGAARLDASLIVCATPFNAVSNEEFEPVLKAIEDKLVSQGGGVHRHPEDVYYGGGEWILLTCILGWHYLSIGRTQEAMQKLQRAASHMDEQGYLPEQVSAFLLHPEHLEPWIQKWGESAKPLLWSHAMFLTLLCELKASGTLKT